MPERINFTKDALTRLTPADDGSIFEINDAKIRELSLLVTKTGVKTFYVRKRVKGKLGRIKIGRFPDITVELARKEAQKILSIIAEEGLKEKCMTLKELYEIFMSKYGDTVARPDKLRDLYRLYLTHWADIRINELEYTTVEDWHRNLPEEIRKRSSKKSITGYRAANTALAFLHSMYERAIKKRWYKGDNPAYGIDKHPENKRSRFLKKEELPRFFKALAEENNRDIRDYLWLSLLLGARQAKILSMRWEDISFSSKEWVIPRSGREKNVATVPIVVPAERILLGRKAFVGNSPWVFPSEESETGHLVEPRKGWERLLKRSGLEDFRPHDLRRTYASWQTITGASLSIVGGSLGHISPNSTTTYARLSLDPIRESLERAFDAMFVAGNIEK